MWSWWIRPAGEVKGFKNILGFLPIVVKNELCKHEHFREVIEKLKEDLIKKGKKKILYYDCLTLIPSFERVQMLDDCKRRLCDEHGVRLIEILEVPRYIPITELREYIKQECSHLKVMLPNDFDTRVIDLRKAYCLSGQSKFFELQGMAAGREGSCFQRLISVRGLN